MRRLSCNDTTICEAIRLYNGNTCELRSGKCRSKYKTCSQAITEEECKIINTTGVTDPDRRVCDFVNYFDSSIPHTFSFCAENYKYCSDYRGSDSQNCSNIKPYDESGNNLDKYYKCEIVQTSIGCEKVPIDCEDAGSNPILCSEYSQHIKDKSVKYCAFYNNHCTEQFKTCEDVINFSSDTTKCTDNIIENYITKECEIDSSNKCVKRNDCNSFNIYSYKELCKNINPNCTYETSSNVCKNANNNCINTRFYTQSEENEQICKLMKSQSNYKICSLKEDKSGCEEIYREQRYPSVAPIEEEEEEQSASKFIKERLYSITMLLLLFS